MPRRAGSWKPPAGVLPAPTGPLRPSWSHEQAALAAGYRAIAGCDEVGRGAWAGPLVAAAVIFPPALIAAAVNSFRIPASEEDGVRDDPDLAMCLAELAAVRDSKQLTPMARSDLDGCVRRQAQIGLGEVSAALCDRIGMAAANRLALIRAIRALPAPPDYLLLDAFLLPGLPLPQLALIKGDSRTVSIAAASIVAKVSRDAQMNAYHCCWPAFAFNTNKGYGTAAHSAALTAYGPTPQHRRSFAPVHARPAEGGA